MSTVALVDYGMGNLHSVRHALEMVGADVVLAARPEDLVDADRIVLPGVGAFGECLANLRSAGLVESLEEQVLHRAKPLLGICLGMQVLATRGEELGDHAGLGWIPGEVRRLPVSAPLRVPHVGWNEVFPGDRTHPVLQGLRPGSTFYFVHSYAFRPTDEAHVAGTCDYGGPFVAMVARDNIVAAQFHPEKSQQNGLHVLEQFLKWKP